TAGMPFDATVTAVDSFGQLAVGYTGTVTFSTTDPDAGVVLPADYTFTLGNGGMHTFGSGFILVTVGNQTFTVTDTADRSITGSAILTVAPSPAPPPGGGANRPLSLTVVTDSISVQSRQPILTLDQVF